ncbi:MAG: tRNA (adenosine(37)-N6)-threonylcarbamoyltransferase complex ATPase subunit type 1 TsaE [Ruminococcaceae bacterium]|nr:tRNA (adenosine(37)-N6)-threonylcarbamoyltransferase complex ATPase subunit type 1 TsaE [Oscillospiraceae bacterium]
MNEKKIYTESAAETEAVGAALAAEMAADSTLPPFVALYGDLGVGKTAFVRGFASVFCEGVAVRSPTFALVNEYRGKRKTLFHFDMYRITGEDDLYSIGYDDYLMRDGICLVEWCENIPFGLPEEYVRVSIEKEDPNRPDRRLIRIKKETLC